MAHTIYTPYGVTLTVGQIKKIKNAHNKGLDVTIKISKAKLTGNDKLHLTELQINKIKKADNGVQLKLSKSTTRSHGKSWRLSSFIRPQYQLY